MEDYPFLPLLAPQEALKVISSSPHSKAQKLLAASLVTQGRIFTYRFPKTIDDLMILDVTHFLNHRINTKLLMAIGEELAAETSLFTPNLVLTAPSSGNIPAVATASFLPGIPDVIYAPKGLPITMQEIYQAKSRSYTQGKSVYLTVAKDCISPESRIAICDDFLDTGNTALDLLSIVKQAGAQAICAFFVIEKPFGGREALVRAGIPNEAIISLVKIDSLRPGKIKLYGYDYWFELVRK
jgi:xanthine phosphoribosyltransferase